MKQTIWILILLLVVVLGGFLLARFLEDNSQRESLRFFLWRTKEFPIGYMVSLSFMAGLLISSVLLLSNLLSRSIELRRLRREIGALQKILEVNEKSNAKLKEVNEDPQR
jgi:uncharacterized integral membrane protein